MRDAWFTQSRYTEGAGCPGHHSSAGCFYLEEVNCEKPLPSGVEVCVNGRENANYTFYNGVLALVDASIPIGGDVSANDIRDQLVAKYGHWTQTQSMAFVNELGANVPLKRYDWYSGHHSIEFDEIGIDLEHAHLFVIDENLYAKVKAATVKSQI